MHDGQTTEVEAAARDEQRARFFCVVAPGRADVLLAPLREHFAGEPRVAVLVERRTPSGERPAGESRFAGARAPVTESDPVHTRAPVAERDPVRALPPELHPEAGHLRLVQRMVPVGRVHEDTEMAELVGRCLETEPDAVSELWWRVSHRVLARLRFDLGDFAATEHATSHVLGRILDELPGHDPEREPLTVWLDAVADRYCDDHRRA